MCGDTDTLEIINQQIEEWMAVKKEILETETKPYMKKVNMLKDDLARWFWEQVYIHMCGGLREVNRHLIRLNYLKNLLIRPNNSSLIDWEQDVEKAKEIPVLELYDFGKVRKTAKGWTALCPFHDDSNPSFAIYSDNNRFYCFGCGVHGDSINFVMLLKKYSFKEAVIELSGRSHKNG